MTKSLIAPEAVEQETFMKWLAVAYPRVYEMTYAVCNERTNIKEGAKYRRRGAKAGVPDVCIAFPVKPYHALYIEFKRRDGGVLSENQKLWIDKLRSKEYAVCVAYGWEQGKNVVEAYLKSLIIYRD